MIPDLLALGWPTLAALALAALVVGFAKTSFGGMGAISVAIFAMVMPARESTATVLLLLLVGDLVAVIRYRTVSWRMLWRLIPGVIPGLLLGAVFMAFVDDVTMRRTIGALLLVMVLMQLWQRRTTASRGAVESTPDGPAAGPRPVAATPEARRESHAPEVEGPQDVNPPVPGVRARHPWRTAATGIAAGFTTMTANAAGPVMALYFLAQRIDKLRFIGTNAWFFALINLSKVPLAASLGLFTPLGLWLDLVLVPVVLLGTVFGVWIIGRVSQRQFETVTLVASAIAALALLLR